jgi:hypothetical protein
MAIDHEELAQIIAEVVAAERRRADARLEAAVAGLRAELTQLKSSALATRVGGTVESIGALIN